MYSNTNVVSPIMEKCNFRYPGTWDESPVASPEIHLDCVPRKSSAPTNRFYHQICIPQTVSSTGAGTGTTTTTTTVPSSTPKEKEVTTVTEVKPKRSSGAWILWIILLALIGLGLFFLLRKYLQKPVHTTTNSSNHTTSSHSPYTTPTPHVTLPPSPLPTTPTPPPMTSSSSSYYPPSYSPVNSTTSTYTSSSSSLPQQSQFLPSSVPVFPPSTPIIPTTSPSTLTSMTMTQSQPQPQQQMQPSTFNSTAPRQMTYTTNNPSFIPTTMNTTTTTYNQQPSQMLTSSIQSPSITPQPIYPPRQQRPARVLVLSCTDCPLSTTSIIEKLGFTDWTNFKLSGSSLHLVPPNKFDAWEEVFLNHITMDNFDGIIILEHDNCSAYRNVHGNSYNERTFRDNVSKLMAKLRETTATCNLEVRAYLTDSNGNFKRVQ